MRVRIKHANLAVTGSLSIPFGGGGGLFFKYFSSSKETVRQFFSSLLSSQSFLEKINICSRCKNQLIIDEELKVEKPFNEDSWKFILKIKQELGFDLNVITPTIDIDTLPVPTCELVG